jgi:hypothetical protein
MFVATCMCVWEECRVFEEGHSLSIYAAICRVAICLDLGFFVLG